MHPLLGTNPNSRLGLELNKDLHIVTVEVCKKQAGSVCRLLIWTSQRCAAQVHVLSAILKPQNAQGHYGITSIGWHAHSMAKQILDSTALNITTAGSSLSSTLNIADVLILVCGSVPDQALPVHTVTLHVPTLLHYETLSHICAAWQSCQKLWACCKQPTTVL